MWTRQFWLDLIERAIKTFAQTLLAAVSADAAVSNVHLPISAKLTAAGIAAGISALSSLVGSGVGAPDSGSWLPKDQDPPQPTAQADAGHSNGLVLLAVLVLVIAIIGGWTATHLLFWLIVLALFLFALGVR